MMQRTAIIGSLFVSLACAAFGCEETSAQSDDDDGGSSSNTGANHAGGSTTSSMSANGGSTSSATSNGGSTSGGGGDGPSIPICVATCATVADCAQASPAFDADNYTCDDGHCTYLGCNDDTECAMQGNFVCRDSYDPLMLGSTRTCVVGCTIADDCDLGGGTAYDADNYDCVQGGCIYTGCNDESECAGIPGGSYTCRDTGTGYPLCQLTCNVAADCDNGTGAAYDADNYVCDSGVCRYTGCNSEAECMTLGDFTCAEP